jgi:hypothetical protein
MRNHGFPRINAAIKGPKSLDEGVEFLKSFDIVVHPRCVHVIDELSTYSYKMDPLTSEVLPELADKKNHCIAEGVLVTCLRGDIPIEQVTTNDMVLTRGGFRRVLFAGQTDADREIMLVRTSAGNLRCTFDHEIFTARGFVRADALRYDDEIINVEQMPWSSVLCGMVGNIAGILTASTKRIGTIFSAPSKVVRHGFNAMYGNSIAGQSQLALKSITLTGIQATTRFQISNFSPMQNIKQCIRGAWKELSSNARYWNASGLLRRNGTVAMKGASVIAKLGPWHTLPSIREKNVAQIAAHGSLRANSEASISIAPTPANQRRVGLLAWMTNCANALRAGFNLRRISIARLRLVRGRVEMLSVVGRCARVYDLTVEEHHEFFAGGVLVSNCIDALRYACEAARRVTRREKKPLEQRAIIGGGWMS